MERKKIYIKFLKEEKKRYRKLLQEINDPENMKYFAYYQIINAIQDIIDGIDPDFKIQDVIMQEHKQRLDKWFNLK